MELSLLGPDFFKVKFFELDSDAEEEDNGEADEVVVAVVVDNDDDNDDDDDDDDDDDVVDDDDDDVVDDDDDDDDDCGEVRDNDAAVLCVSLFPLIKEASYSRPVLLQPVSVAVDVNVDEVRSAPVSVNSQLPTDGEIFRCGEREEDVC